MNKRLQIRKASGGFTLLEALFATMLIGLVIAALVATSGAFTMANAAGVDLSTSEFLIEEIRELSAMMSFEELPDLTVNSPYSPPIDVSGQLLNDFAAFEQQVAVENCGLEFNAPDDDFVRITVTIIKSGRPVSQTSWIRARLN